jgi:hypothetical protein
LPKVRLELAEEEQASFSSPDSPSLQHDDASPSVWLIAGLEIEEQQYVSLTIPHGISSEFCFRRRLVRDRNAVGMHASPLQRAKLLERSSVLQRKIDGWRAIQAIYLPGADILRTRAQRSTPVGVVQEQPHTALLYLPSAVIGLVPCDRTLLDYEWRLRFAQTQDALNELRDNLRVRTHLFKTKRRFSRGVAANTRAQLHLKRQQDKVDSSAKKYSVARNALDAFAKPLHQLDWEYLVRPPEAPLEVYPEVSVFEGSKRPNPCPDLAYLRVVWGNFCRTLSELAYFG